MGPPRPRAELPQPVLSESGAKDQHESQIRRFRRLSLEQFHAPSLIANVARTAGTGAAAPTLRFSHAAAASRAVALSRSTLRPALSPPSKAAPGMRTIGLAAWAWSSTPKVAWIVTRCTSNRSSQVFIGCRSTLRYISA